MSFLDCLDRHNRLFGRMAGLEEAAAEMAGDVERALRGGGKVLFLGNGGSAADCQHLAAEFVVRFAASRRALAALALTTDASILTAQANDRGFSSVFSRQLEALCRPGDVVIALSTSGNSQNVVEAVAAARDLGATCWGWTGGGGGRLGATGCKLVTVPSTETARVQEAHLFVGHWLCEEMDRRFAAA